MIVGFQFKTIWEKLCVANLHRCKDYYERERTVISPRSLYFFFSFHILLLWILNQHVKTQTLLCASVIPLMSVCVHWWVCLRGLVSSVWTQRDFSRKIQSCPLAQLALLCARTGLGRLSWHGAGPHGGKSCSPGSYTVPRVPTGGIAWTLTEHSMSCLSMFLLLAFGQTDTHNLSLCELLERLSFLHTMELFTIIIWSRVEEAV